MKYFYHLDDHNGVALVGFQKFERVQIGFKHAFQCPEHMSFVEPYQIQYC